MRIKLHKLGSTVVPTLFIGLGGTINYYISYVGIVIINTVVIITKTH